MVAETWSWEQEKAFENAVAIHHNTCSDWWEKIVAHVPGKTLEEIKNHYEILAEDVHNIESGRIPLPNYPSPSSSAAEVSGDGGKGSRLDHERRKGIAWTEEEHRLFLLGLDKYGKGDWRSISRNFVISRTPTQVASHAQKYFIRLNSMNKDRRRSSIHDITNSDLSKSQGPITGQVNNVQSSITTKCIKQPSHTTTSAHVIPMYVSAIGRPLGRPLMPAVGTPVAAVAAGAPVYLSPSISYPMHNSSSCHK